MLCPQTDIEELNFNFSARQLFIDVIVDDTFLLIKLKDTNVSLTKICMYWFTVKNLSLMERKEVM